MTAPRLRHLLFVLLLAPAAHAQSPPPPDLPPPAPVAAESRAGASEAPAVQTATPTQASADGMAGAATSGDAGDTTGAASAAGPEDLPVDPSGTPSPPPEPPPADARTQAERDFDALYGNGEYDPVADATLPDPAELPASYDPWERMNRRTHAFNNLVDRAVAKPLANFYVAVTPRPVRLGVGNFFSNLGQPVSALNALLQGRPAQAGQSLGRFLVNSTVGVAGFFDPATRMRIPNRSEDFGQTLGIWGWKRSRYVELPLFGPRTVRDVFGLVGDGQLSPIRQIERDRVRVFTQGLQLVDVRTQLMAIDSLREGATDEYALFRDSWLQRRNYQIFGDRHAREAGLPDYLRDGDELPDVPADAMPIIPGAGLP